MRTIETSIEHPLRRRLNREVHARPPDHIETPSAISYLVRVPPRDLPRGSELDLLEDFCSRFDLPKPESDTKHYAADADKFRVRWERHTEFNRYTFIADLGDNEPFANPPIREIPDDWLAQMEEQLLVASDAVIVPLGDYELDIDKLSGRFFNGNPLVGSRVDDGAAVALTDLQIQQDGVTRLLLLNETMSSADTGRMIQRLLEIQTYRMMALLALPVAQELAPILDAEEREIAAITAELVNAESEQEQALLQRMTELSAASQSRQVKFDYRFAAAEAYYDIVMRRIDELREARMPGLQTRVEFTTRRLTPAVSTCRAIAKRQQTMLEQIARATKLLSTRVDIAREQQNQTLLESMNRRAKTQLRLQATVEGLSVAAMTYYVVGLIGIMSEGLKEFGLPLEKSVVMGASIPLVAMIAFLGVRQLRKKISREDDS